MRKGHFCIKKLESFITNPNISICGTNLIKTNIMLCLFHNIMDLQET